MYICQKYDYNYSCPITALMVFIIRSVDFIVYYIAATIAAVQVLSHIHIYISVLGYLCSITAFWLTRVDIEVT